MNIQNVSRARTGLYNIYIYVYTHTHTLAIACHCSRNMAKTWFHHNVKGGTFRNPCHRHPWPSKIQNILRHLHYLFISSPSLIVCHPHHDYPHLLSFLTIQSSLPSLLSSSSSSSTALVFHSRLRRFHSASPSEGGRLQTWRNSCGCAVAFSEMPNRVLLDMLHTESSGLVPFDIETCRTTWCLELGTRSQGAKGVWKHVEIYIIMYIMIYNVKK